MIFLELFYVFFKLGLFAFGGGYAIITMIQTELLARNWASMEEFANIVAVSQITPGPIGLNAATYVGYTVGSGYFGYWGGVIGAVIATAGTIAPSLILVLTTVHFMNKFYSGRVVQGILYGVRPVTVGLIAGACYSFAAVSRFADMRSIVVSVIIFAAGAILSFKTKLSAVWIIFICAIFGIIFY